MTNGEYVTRIVKQDEDFCILTDGVAGTVTIEVSLAWWSKPKAESEDKLDGDPIDIDKETDNYKKTLELLKGIDLEDKA